MNKVEREKFRKSYKWKKFRAFAKDYYGNRDYITHAILQRDWNLHHLNLDMNKYSDLSEISNFIPLNKDVHKALHTLHFFWKKDPAVIDRLLQVFEKMRSIKNGN